MAMLAEKRSKQKWSEDPRNINWSRDKDRYGYQMLEKMGWADGKGLGSKQNGKTSHVKIRKRKHNLGLGAKESHDQDWIAHQEDFNNLLSALHQHGGNAELRSEEQNKKAMLDVAKASRKRVFYKKFIRSKDTSQYSEKDLACIFGGTPSPSAPATPQKSDEEVHSDDSSTSCHTIPTNSSGDSAFVTYTSKQNIQEYFARRMQELRGGGRDDKEHGGSMEDKKECEQSTESEKEREGNKVDENECERSIGDEKGYDKSCQRSEKKTLSDEKGDKKSKRKKRKEKEEEKEYVEVDEPKRKKKKRTTTNEENGLDAVECLTNGACVDDVNASENLGDCAQVEVKRKESKKKKNRSKTRKENGLDAVECLTNGECDSGEIVLQTEHDGCSEVEIKRKKSKSRKKEKKERKGNESNAAGDRLTNEACVNGDSVSEKTATCSKLKVKRNEKKKAEKN